jgi:hypothetical protein
MGRMGRMCPGFRSCAARWFTNLRADVQGCAAACACWGSLGPGITPDQVRDRSWPMRST